MSDSDFKVLVSKSEIEQLTHSSNIFVFSIYLKSSDLVRGHNFLGLVKILSPGQRTEGKAKHC